MERLSLFLLTHYQKGGTLYLDPEGTQRVLEGFEYSASGSELTIYYVPDENWNDNWDMNGDGQPDGPDSFFIQCER